MREMKDSGIEWIGEIPTAWAVVSTKHLFQIFSGATPDSSKAENWDGDINWITPADYKTSDMYVDKGRRSLSHIGFASCSTNMIPAGNLIFSKRAPIGSVAINRTDLCTNQGCLSCVSKGNNSVMYYYYVISIATEYYELLGSGTTFKEISASSFSNFSLPSPSYQDQLIISNFLNAKCDKVNTLIQNVQTQIEKLKTYKQSLITEVVTKGLDPTVPMKDSGVEWIGEIPEHWNIISLGGVTSEMRNGYVGPTRDLFVDNGVRYIQSLHTRDGLIDFYKHPYYVREEWANQHPKVHTGDVLIVQTGDIGQVALVNDEFDCCNCHALIIEIGRAHV